MRRPDRLRIWSPAIAAFCLCTALPLWAGVYFWTDENGVRHYSNVAPPDTDREIERLDEIPPSAPNTPGPADTVETAPQAPTASETKIVGELQRQLEQIASRRDQILQSERQRLARAIEQLQKKPLSEFGSQKNKTRAVGYYRYRLQALQDSPDTYFQYGDSDID